MGLTKAFSLLLLFLAHLDLIVSQAIIRPPKIDARTQYLYSNASASATLSIRPFTFSFAITAYSSVPSFGYGLNDFKFNNSLSRVYFLSEVTNLTATSVTIQTTNDNATKISKLSISYIAVWQFSGVFIISKTFSNMSNLTVSSGSRFYQLYQVFKVTSTAVSAVHFLRGFLITSNIASYIYVNITVDSTENYLVRITTLSDCKLWILNLDILFYYTDSTTADYVLGGDTTSFSQTTANINQYNQTLVNYTNTAFIIGLGGFFGFTFSTKYVWGWSVVSLSDNVATIQLNHTNMQTIHYSYFQIGYKQPANTQPNPNGTAQAASPEKTNYIGIIVGLIVGVGAVSVAVVAIVKIYFKNIVYVIPEKNDFRALPAITF